MLSGLQQMARMQECKQAIVHQWRCLNSRATMLNTQSPRPPLLQMNLADSERMAGSLESLGYSCVEEASDADVLIYNTGRWAVQRGAERLVGHCGGLVGCCSSWRCVTSSHIPLTQDAHCTAICPPPCPLQASTMPACTLRCGPLCPLWLRCCGMMRTAHAPMQQ